MRVMYILFSFTVGGTERLVVDICNEMVKQNNEVYLYIINDLYDTKLFENLLPDVKIICKNRPVGSKKKYREIFEINTFCKKHKIDVIHCNSFNIPELLIVTKIFQRKIRIIYTIHGLGQFANISKYRIFYRNYVCDSIIAISESVKEDIINEGIIPKKISVVYNAIDLEKFERKKYKEVVERTHAITIGNVARIDCRQKGQDILVSAIDELKKDYTIRCLFAGAADKEHQHEYNELKKRAEKIESESNSQIVFMGNVDNIPKFLESIDIFVLPSRIEGFGISLIEAMKMNIPCVACDLNGPREIIGGEERGTLFETGNAKDLANKLRNVIENYDLYAKKAYDAEKYVKKNYDIKNMVMKLEKIYKGE